MKNTSMGKLPNILLVTIDCLRPDHLGCGGCRKNTSPFIDQLCERSLFFPEGIANGVYTAASIPSLLTSRFPHEDGGFESIRAKTITESLKQKGYSTAAFIDSNPFISPRVGYARGFDQFFNPVYDFLCEKSDRIHERSKLFRQELENWVVRRGPRLVSCVARYLFSIYRAKKDIGSLSPYLGGEKLNKIVLDWIEKQRSRFFVWIHYMDVHLPYRISQEYYEKVNMTEYSRFAMEKVNIKLDSGNADEWDVQLIKDIYDAEIRLVDECIREIFESVKEMADNTLLVLTADHGEEFLEHGRHHSNLQLYDEVLKVPIIIQAPGIKQEKFSSQVELIDVVPTILDFIGLPPEKSYMGNTLLSPVKEKKMIFTEANYYQIMKNPQRELLKLSWRKTSIRFSEGEEKWKYIHDAKTNTEELYDLLNDPDEKNDLSGVESKRKTLVNARRALFYHLRRQKEKHRRKDRLERKIKELRQKYKEANYAPAESSVSSSPNYLCPLGS